ncbi:MAG: YHS domain-containing (seleno)protein [Pseudomonadota bacterium]
MRNRPNLFKPLWLGVLLLVSGAAAAAAPHPCAPDGVAVGGYDLVSYRLADGPVRGDADFTAEYEGLTYRFASSAHLSQFLDEPERYLPRYRGWCATNLAFGRLACPEYTNFKIEDGDLLLFEHHGFTNGRSLWNSDPLHHRGLADRQADRLLP